ncbi:MAG: UDP-N-acetylmuramoyl-L-alanine--D-glutamate ligase [Cellvibrionaceae bacterium]
MTLIATSKLTVIVGLGVTGLAAARFLQRRHIRFIAMDSRENPPGLAEFKECFPEVNLITGHFDESLLTQADEIILNPGVSLKIPEVSAAIRAGVSVIGDIELFAREVSKPVIAITGSNAKTTVTTLVGKMAEDAGIKASVGGNIGTPVLDLLEGQSDLYILELSSFQLETTHSLKATVATVLNVTADHMDRYTDLAEYYRAKQKIYFGAENIVVNRADALTQPPVAEGVKCLSFGLNNPDRNGFGVITRNNEQQLAYEFKALLPIDQVKLRGQHNIANCLAALAIGFAAGFPMDKMLSTLTTFEGLPHRCQFVSSINGVDYINDSKATNVGATLAAINGFAHQDKKNIVLIAGGDGKGADFSPLKTPILNSVRVLVLIGRDAKEIAAIVGDDVFTIYAESLEKAVSISKEHAVAGEIVLLSPACASFDMFTGYEERGNQFIAATERIAA